MGAGTTIAIIIVLAIIIAGGYYVYTTYISSGTGITVATVNISGALSPYLSATPPSDLNLLSNSTVPSPP